MIKVIKGDLFESPAQTLVNTVNTEGVMGKGIALEFKRRFPDVYDDYVSRCKRGEVRLGQPYLFRRLFAPWVVNFPTKLHWRSVSRLQDIDAGLEHLGRHAREWGITSLAMPPLGCGQGRLDWRDVGPLIYRRLSGLPIEIELFAPSSVPDSQMTSSFLEGRSADTVPSGRAGVEPASLALVAIVDRVVREPYHWPIGRTTFQKIAYFATRSGLHTGLSFERGSFGPFSPRLKDLQTRLTSSGLLEEKPLGRMFSVRPGPSFRELGVEEQARQWEPIIERVSDLFLRMKTADAEVAATVAFVSDELRSRFGRDPSEMEILEEVRRWKARRNPPLCDADVARSIRSMNVLGWISAAFSAALPVPEDVPDEEAATA